MTKQSNEQAGQPALPVGLAGWGEGGRIALYAGALDERIGPVCVSGYFGPRQGMWQEPIDRNVFGLLNRYGDAELAAMKSTGSLIIDTSPGTDRISPHQRRRAV